MSWKENQVLKGDYFLYFFNIKELSITLTKALHGITYPGMQENNVWKHCRKGGRGTQGWSFNGAYEGKCRCTSVSAACYSSTLALIALFKDFLPAVQICCWGSSLQEPSKQRHLQSCLAAALCASLLSLPLAGSHYRPLWPSVVLLARRIACLLLKPLSMPGLLERRTLLLPRAVLLSWM